MIDEAAMQEVARLSTELAERVADLQRLQAEYLNYKRRVDRDREVVRQSSVAGVLTSMLPILDDIERARDYGQLEGGFKAVADAIDRVMAAQGLQRFGTPGEPFDPTVHEALMHSYAEPGDDSAPSAGPVAATILQPGFKVGERIIRPARVAVVEPASVATDGVAEAADAAPDAAPDAGSDSGPGIE